MSGYGDRGGIFGHLEELPFGLSHLKVWLTAGMGFFTDAYDLFIIGAIITIFNAYKLPGFYDPGLEALLASSAIFTAIAGQVLFGRIADLMGRKFIYGIEAAILSAGALLSALSPNILWLLVFRSILGLGIGGDYPLSATIASEYSGRRTRGKMVALVFANQGLGTIAAVAVAMAAVAYLPPDLAWRVAAGFGAIPALSVIYLRRKLPETPRYSALVRGDYEEARRAAGVLGARLEGEGVVARRLGVWTFLRRYWVTLIATAVSWFLVDIALYGTGIYSSSIVSGVMGSSGSLVVTIFESGIPFLVGVPGYFTAVALIDRVGRKSLQIAGFLGMALVYVYVAHLLDITGGAITRAVPAYAALAIYSLSFFAIDAGPNTTTFVIPSEVFPVRYRTTGHGISAAMGKLGAGISTLFLIPYLRSAYGLPATLEVLALVSVLGAAVTLLLREPARRTLEEASLEELVPAAAPVGA
ncbi:MAG: MFS transporter [Conexivisphaera sp.]